MKPERLRKFDREKLIEFIVRKDEEIASLKSRYENLKYIGRLTINAKWYAFYIREDD